MYNVVFEYTQKAGGFCGVRTWTTYLNKAQFNKLWQNDGLQTVLQEGVSDYEASKLTSQTKESSRIKAAIHQSFGDNDYLDPVLLLNHYLFNALTAIIYDRNLNGRESFTLTEMGCKSFAGMKAREILYAVVDTCSDPTTGQVDLDMIDYQLKVAVLGILKQVVFK